ncbi:MAG: cysteine desulfurase [Defluviitaleaceae bacterium]|nr:cysteine desulfurase [Defluviitaleaceae bacterium]
MIFFDNASTTPIFPEIIDILKTFWGNPSSRHAQGLAAEKALDEASAAILSAFGNPAGEIIFTSGGTESNNLAIQGAASPFRRAGGSILTTGFEHPATAAPLLRLQNENFKILRAHPDEIPSLVAEDSIMVCVSHTEGETGGTFDACALGSAVKRRNPNAVVFVDGAQGFCKERIKLQNVDLYSFSSHKFHGPPGTGGLFVKKGTKLSPLFFGGGQQSGLRPGTQNVAGALATAEACRLSLDKINENRTAVRSIKCVLSGLAQDLPGVFINECFKNTSPYILNMSFEGVRGETLVNALSALGIYVSTGAACRAKKGGPSPLESMGCGRERAESAVRFSFSHMNNVGEANRVREITAETVQRLRALKKK